MKKLLSLLSVLTISGTAIPTTIAASPYQKKQESINDINNLESLNRNKREIETSINFLKTIEVSDTNQYLNKPVIYNENIIYFVTHQKVIEYNLKNMTSNVVITSDKNLKFGVILNNRLYVVSSGGSIFEYNIKDKISKNVYSIIDNNNTNPEITYGLVLNNNLYFVTNFMTGKEKIYKYNPINKEIEVIFEDLDIYNLEFDNSDGLSKITFVHNNKYYKYFGSGEIIETNILYRENYSKLKNKINLYNNEYYFSDDNFKLYEKNKNNLNTTKIYEYKKFYDSYKMDNNWIFELNGRIYFKSQDASKFNEYYSFESILVNEPIFNLWIKNFKNWIEELNNTNISSLAENDVSNKIQIFLQYLREFNQNLEIIRNKENIRELSSRISVLENNVLELKNQISNIINNINEINFSSSNGFKNCSTSAGILSSVAGLVPVVGGYISAGLSSISSICGHFS